VNLAACHSLPTRGVSGTWFRAIDTTFLRRPLVTKYSRLVRSRFNHGKHPGMARSALFEVLYLSENHLVGQLEMGALLGSLITGHLVGNPHVTVTVLPMRVQLQRVADLTDPASQSLLATTAQEMTGDWQGYHVR
jgi:hypothetical protein